MNKKQVLISAFIGSNNLGDEAIFKSILDKLSINRQQITALCVNEEKTKKQGVKTLYSKSIRNIIKGVRECDVMLVGGGGIIQDQSSILNFIYYAFQLRVAKHYKKPVILCFVGVGPIRFRLSKWLMSRIIPSIEYAIVRDEKSREQLLKYLSEDIIYQAHDPVLNFPFASKDIKNVYTKNKPYFVVSLRRWFFTNPFLPVSISRKINKMKIFKKNHNEYMSKLAKDMDTFLDANPSLTAILVSLYDTEDDVINSELLEMMRNKKRVVIAENNMDEYNFLSIVKNSEFILGMRLHSLILGANINKPFVALRYSTKVDEFTEQMGLTDYSIHVEHYDSAVLQASLNRVWSNRKQLSQRMGKVVKEYRRENNKAFSILNRKISKLIL